MGEHKNISINRFPKQSDWVGKDVEVCFNYDTSKKLNGKIVRDDMESPWEMIIEVEYELPYGKRCIKATECQYSIKEEKQTVEFLETPLHGAIPLYAIVSKINEIIKTINALERSDLINAYKD